MPHPNSFVQAAYEVNLYTAFVTLSEDGEPRYFVL